MLFNKNLLNLNGKYLQQTVDQGAETPKFKDARMEEPITLNEDTASSTGHVSQIIRSLNGFSEASTPRLQSVVPVKPSANESTKESVAPQLMAVVPNQVVT